MVLRLDRNGNIKWGKTYGGRDWDRAFAVTVAPNGDIIIVGYYGATDQLGAGADAWVLRLDGNGNVKWQKTYGGKDHDIAYGIVITPDRDIIVAGATKSFGASDWNAWALRLPPDGTLPGCNFCNDSIARVINTNVVVKKDKC